MRLESLLALASVTLVLAGCSTESPKASTDETAMAPRATGAPAHRDLTLRTSAAATLEVASPVELSRPAPPPPRRTARKISPEPAPAPAPEPRPEAAPAFEAAVPVPSPAVAEVAADPGAPVEDVDVGAGRELAPGKTVRIVPATAGPSTEPADDGSWGVIERTRGSTTIGGGIGGGRGGRCKPRGGARGIGIAGRIPVSVPGLRLR